MNESFLFKSLKFGFHYCKSLIQILIGGTLWHISIWSSSNTLVHRLMSSILAHAYSALQMLTLVETSHSATHLLNVTSFTFSDGWLFIDFMPFLGKWSVHSTEWSIQVVSIGMTCSYEISRLMLIRSSLSSTSLIVSHFHACKLTLILDDPVWRTLVACLMW